MLILSLRFSKFNICHANNLMVPENLVAAPPPNTQDALPIIYKVD